ncbi:MAG: peptidyl-prolyl cis-trans isomerase [Bacteroidales bacterium]|nr:peptidyl-prolyl cis-trans isomerase [Bacteroidales bacterium]
MKPLKIKISIYLIPLLFLMHGCSLLENPKKEEAVARVFDTYLYMSEVKGAIPEGTSSKDSTIIARNYIDTWVRKQLMLNRAEIALSEEQKDFEKKLEEYRSSLLIYSYRQKLLQQKIDTTVHDEEILEYYENNINNFILSDEVVMAIFVKLPLDAPDISSVRNWTRSAANSDIDNLEKYSVNYAEKFDMFNNSWIYFSDLMKQVPLSIEQPSRFLRYNDYFETSDSLYHYFIHIIDHKSEGNVTPLSLIKMDIKSILLNKRKIEFYKNLEQQVYNEGLNKNQFEIFR